MFNSFNNQSIRKLVVAFGSLFDEIYITRKNDTTGVEEKYKVPITFSSKEKFLRRLEQNSSISDNVKTQINLPYLSFDINGIVYDNNRKRNKLRVASTSETDEETAETTTYKTFAETPISVSMNLYFYTRNLDEIFQIIEQVSSYFNPEFNIRLNFNEIHKNINVPISMRDIKILDDHEGSFGSKRTTIGTINFAVSSYLFGEIKSGSSISTFTFNIDEDPDDTTYAALLNSQTSNIILNPNYLNQTYALTGTSDPKFISNFTWTENNVTENFTIILLYDEITKQSIGSIRILANTLTLTQADVGYFTKQLAVYIKESPYDAVPCIPEIILLDYQKKPKYYFKISNGQVSTTFPANINTISVCT
jgi:hypothetical protein